MCLNRYYTKKGLFVKEITYRNERLNRGCAISAYVKLYDAEFLIPSNDEVPSACFVTSSILQLDSHLAGLSVKAMEKQEFGQYAVQSKLKALRLKSSMRRVETVHFRTVHCTSRCRDGHVPHE